MQQARCLDPKAVPSFEKSIFEASPAVRKAALTHFEREMSALPSGWTMAVDPQVRPRACRPPLRSLHPPCSRLPAARPPAALIGARARP